MSNKDIFYEITKQLFIQKYGNCDNKIKRFYFMNIIMYLISILITFSLLVMSILSLVIFNNIILFTILLSICFFNGIFLITIYDKSIFSYRKKIKQDIKNGNYKAYKLKEQISNEYYYKITLNNNDNEINGYIINPIKNENIIIFRNNNYYYIIEDNNILFIYDDIPDKLQELQKDFINIIKHITGEDIDFSKSLIQQKIDNIDFINIIISIEDFYKIDIPIDLFSIKNNLNEIIIKIQSMFNLKRETI